VTSRQTQAGRRVRRVSRAVRRPQRRALPRV